MSTKLLAFALTSVVICLTSGIAAAQAPAVHYGTFAVGAPGHCGGHSFCSSVARKAMTDEHVKVSSADRTALIGLGPNVTVVVLCVPEGDRSFAAVIASSPVSATAEATRNAVRQRMVAARCL